MKKRLNSSEIEQARKSSRIIFLITFILLVFLFAGFGLLYVMDVDVVKFVKTPQKKVEEVGKKITKDVINKEESTIAFEVDVNDGNVQKFFNAVKITDSDICFDGGYKEQEHVLVGSLSTKCKFSIASNIYEKDVQKALDGKLYVKETDVKSAYEELFGNGTYQRQDSIPCLYKSTFMFHDDYYFTEKVASEEGGSLTSYEKVLFALREGDKLDITSSVLYYEHVLNLFCRDSRCESVIEELKTGSDYNEDYLSLYVDHNKDELYQYTYHFEMDKTGFYRYIGYDRTNE